MSHTDKTAPWHVRMAARPGRSAVEHHDHRFGPCDLTELSPHVERRTDIPASESPTCRWEPGPGLFYGRDSGCGCPCPMCTAQWDRRRRNKQDRRQVRAQLTRAVRTGTTDPDVPTRRRPLYW